MWRSTDCLKLFIDWSSDAETNADGNCHVGVGRGKEGDHRKMERSRTLPKGSGCTFTGIQLDSRTLNTHMENQKDRHSRPEEAEEGVFERREWWLRAGPDDNEDGQRDPSRGVGG